MKKKKFIDLLYIIAFKILLELSYVYFVFEYFEYAGYKLDINCIKLVESYIIIIILYFFLPYTDDKPSSIVLKILYVLMILPMSSYYYLTNNIAIYYYAFVFSFFLTIITILIVPSFQIRKRFKESNMILVLFFTLIIFGTYTFLLLQKGIPSTKAFNLTEVYEIRGSVESSLYAYPLAWLSNVINCFLIGYFWYRRKYFFLITIFLLQILLFLYVGEKSYLLAPFEVLVIVVCLNRYKFMRVMLVGLSSLIAVSFLLSSIDVTKLPSSLFVRRVLYAPAAISYHYYDYFEKNPYTYYSQSKLGLGLLENPYANSSGKGIAEMMGNLYSVSDDNHMNTGYLGDAYKNMGILGMIINSFILGVILVIADSVSKDIKLSIAITAIIIPIQKLINGALLTSLLTSGLLIGLIILWLYKCNTKMCLRNYPLKCFRT
jgi:hypothetical protein